jgi:hypothetical protein
MGYVEIVRRVQDHELDICDQCGQQGVRENGKMITDNYSQDILWFCYNCVEAQTKSFSK